MHPSPKKLHPHAVLLLQHGNSRIGQLGQLEELQLHVPLAHTRELVHTCPHDPQLLPFVCSFTHAPLHGL